MEKVLLRNKGFPATGQGHNVWAAAAKQQCLRPALTAAVSISFNQLNVGGEVPHQLDRLHHLMTEGYVFLKFLTSNVTTGVAAIIRQCESKDEYEASMKRKEAWDRRQLGRTCLVLAREGCRQYNQIKGEELFQEGARTEGLLQGLQGETHERILFSP